MGVRLQNLQTLDDIYLKLSGDIKKFNVSTMTEDEKPYWPGELPQ